VAMFINVLFDCHASLKLLAKLRMQIDLACCIFRYADPCILNTLPPNLRYIDSIALASNPISKLTYSLLRAFLGILAPNNSFRALLTQHNSCSFTVATKAKLSGTFTEVKQRRPRLVFYLDK